LANYDALQATKRMAIFSFASTIAGASSAVAEHSPHTLRI
jgi:hypothetical protein